MCGAVWPSWAPSADYGMQRGSSRFRMGKRRPTICATAWSPFAWQDVTNSCAWWWSLDGGKNRCCCSRARWRERGTHNRYGGSCKSTSHDGKLACPVKDTSSSRCKTQDRPRSRDSGLVAGEASWRESKTAEPSDNILGKECAQRTRLQHTVN